MEWAPRPPSRQMHAYSTAKGQTYRDKVSLAGDIRRTTLTIGFTPQQMLNIGENLTSLYKAHTYRHKAGRVIRPSTMVIASKRSIQENHDRSCTLLASVALITRHKFTYYLKGELAAGTKCAHKNLGSHQYA